MNEYDSEFEFPVIDDGKEFDWNSLFAPQEPSAPVVAAVEEVLAIPTAETGPKSTEEPKSETAIVPAAPSPPVKPEAEPVSVFDKPPVFSYGGAKENITDASMTFEELRIQKADDFPELEEGKSVSWRVRYEWIDQVETINRPEGVDLE